MKKDQDVGKLYKDAFENYESVIDEDKLFASIEDQLPPQKKSRRGIFFLLGCAGVTIFILSVVLFFLVYDSPQKLDSFIAVKVDNLDSTHKKSFNRNDDLDTTLIIDSTQLIADSPIIKSRFNEKKIQIKDLKSNTPSIFEINGKSNIEVKKIFKVKDIANNVQQEIEDKLGVNSNNNFDGGKECIIVVEDLEDVKTINPIGYITDSNQDLILSQILPLTIESVELLRAEIQLPDVTTYPKRKIEKESKWELGISAIYLWPLVNNSYKGIQHQDWFNNYNNTTKLHLSLNGGISLKYYLNKRWYLIGALDFIKAQESHSYNTTFTETVYNEDIPDTIFVDRNFEPLDTIFGGMIANTTISNNYLVTDLNFLGIGIGIGRKFDISDKWTATFDYKIMPYLIQKAKGFIIAPDDKLSSQSSFPLENKSTSLNNNVIANQFNLSLRYRITRHWHLGITTSGRFHFGNFSNNSSLSQTRNYFGTGVTMAYKF